MNRHTRGKLFFTLILTVPLIPLVTAIFFYKNPHYLSGEVTVQGQLLRPPLDGAFLREEGERKWLLVVPAADPCDRPCQTNLFFIRQTHAALGKNRDRLGRVMLKDSSASLPEQLKDELERQVPPLRIREISAEELRELFERIFTADESPADNSVYVTDPLGNIMLRHEPLKSTKDAKTLLKDLKHLFRASHIG